MNIELESQEQGAYVNRIFSKGGDYEAGCFRSSHFIEPDAIRPGLTTDDAGNLVFYSNPDVDKLLDEARQTDDFDDRKEKYFEVQEITGRGGAADHHALRPVRQRLRRRPASARRRKASRTRWVPSSPGCSTPWADGSGRQNLTPPGRGSN